MTDTLSEARAWATDDTLPTDVRVLLFALVAKVEYLQYELMYLEAGEDI